MATKPAKKKTVKKAAAKKPMKSRCGGCKKK